MGLTPGNYSGMGALLRAHVRKIYILSQLVKNLGESVRGGKDRKTLPPEKGRTAPMYFEGLKLRGNICLTLAQPAELRGKVIVGRDKLKYSMRCNGHTKEKQKRHKDL